tara:strand:- start:4790 stop:10639 length:5850 start_codon:yes stop_codon:yes gene_type:complete
MSDTEIFLELGDIIRINSKTNKQYDKNIYYIGYLDENRMSIVNANNMKESVLNILNENLTDESINSIEILSKSVKKGYARQNGLVTGAWITIQMGGDVPFTINGQITNLDEDMIEITKYPDEKKLYIDFGYKGIPLTLPIENIKPFEIPEKPNLSIPDLEMDLGLDVLDDEEDEEYDDLGPPVINVSSQLKKVLLDADDIVFGEELEAITEFVPVRKDEHRFGLETQTADLLDDLLSTIPTHKRTPRILNQIHITIERFKQLREKFSIITSDGIGKPKKKGANYKPLVERMEKLDKKLYWLLPIVKNKRKLYDINQKDDYNTDFISTTLADSQNELNHLMNEYTNNIVPDSQNKYNYLNIHSNNVMIPYYDPNDKYNVIIQKPVETEILTIVDNMNDFYSSVVKNNNVVKQRFVLNKTNTSLSRLVSTDNKKVLQSARRQNMYQNDKIAITGFLTLKEPVLLYSHINLPTTSILKKSQLSQTNFNYFSILKNNTNIETIEIKENDESFEYNESKYLKNITSMIFDESLNYDDRDKNEAYKHFLDKIFPKTRVLFNLVKKYIKLHNSGVSYSKIIQHLEPFLIYPDDITFKQYETIVKFIDESILELKRDFVKNIGEIRDYLHVDYGEISRKAKNNILNLLNDNQDSEDQTNRELLNLYQLSPKTTNTFALNRMMHLDDMKLFSTLVSLSAMDLYQPIDVETIVANAQRKDSEESQKMEENEKCGDLVLAKQYIDIHELREDDNKSDVFFDEKYDVTRYDINDEFQDEKDTMDDNSYREFITEHLTKNVGLNDSQALIESEALTIKKRRIAEGNYAFVENDDGNFIYFKRTSNNTWERDEDGNFSSHHSSSKMFCNTKKNCMQIKNDCASMDITKGKIADDLTKDILKQFDLQLNLEYKELKSDLEENIVYYSSIIPSLRLIQLNKFLKTDLYREKLGESAELSDNVVSPYANLRDAILSQDDFVQKQSHILMFVSKLCRPANDFGLDEPEDIHWYYCKRKDIPLLPTFYTELAEAFERGDYKNTLERVCAQRGQISDDGDKIVDKYSGYIIRNIEYDGGEGYDEAGYRVVSREVLEEDIGNVLMNVQLKSETTLESIDSKMIYRVISTLDKSLGIDVVSDYDFIIKGVVDIINRYIGNKKLYMKRLKKRQTAGKKGISYEKAHDETLIIYTLSYYLIAIQTSIPSITTMKTFPGCVRSFSGFPLEPDGDSSALLYLVCTMLRLKQAERPWSVLPRISKKKEEAVTSKFSTKISKGINSILNDTLINQKLETKRKYLREHLEIDEIPEIFDVKNWVQFLPPLVPIKMKQVSNISSSFKNVFINAMKKGDKTQSTQLNTLRGKIIAFSLHIQELIQKVVRREAPLLKNLSDEPMLENACCNQGIRKTLEYFTDKEPGILKYNKMVKELEDIISIVKEKQTSHYIFSPLDTRFKYPNLSESFSEETIYISFLRFCRLKSSLPPEIQRHCNHPIIKTFTTEDTLEHKISILKREGIDINAQWFRQIFKSVNKINNIDINLHPIILSERHILEKKIQHLKEKQSPIICNPEILTAFTDLIDTFDTIRDDDESYLKMQSFLDDTIEVFQNHIIEFLSNAGIDEGIESIFDNMVKWKARGEEIYMTQSDETSLSLFTFYNIFIKNMMLIYPNMIIKSVSFENISIPKHWKISDRHVKELKKNMFSEVSSLHKFYGDKDLFSILKYVQEQSKDIIDLMKSTTLFADLILKDKIAPTIMNGSIITKLSQFYLMCNISIYINALEGDLFDEYDGMEPSDLLDVVDTEGVDTRVKQQQLEGKKDVIKKKVANLLTTYLTIMKNQKNKLNINKEDITKKVLKAKEKEKNKVTKRLGDLTVEEREVENIKKNQRLGAWSLGQTRALFEYDAMQYDKERQEIDNEMSMESRLDRRPEVTIGNRDVYRTEELQEQAQQQLANAEFMNDLFALGDDDDFGERDGD